MSWWSALQGLNTASNAAWLSGMSFLHPGAAFNAVGQFSLNDFVTEHTQSLQEEQKKGESMAIGAVAIIAISLFFILRRN